MNRIVLVSGLALLLAGCSSFTDKPTQKISIQTPGTDNALCFLLRPGFRDRVWTPTTVRLTKSAGPLTVDCLAPGNREKKIVITPTIARSFYGNYATFMVGGAYDYETAAMYQYPDTIVVDFTDVPVSKMPLPGYQKLYTDHPELVGMDVTRPGLAALPSDRTTSVQELQPRGPGDGDDALLGSGASDVNVITGAPGPGDTDNKVPGAGASSATSISSGTTSRSSNTPPPVAGSGRPAFNGQGKSIFDTGSSSSATTSSTTGSPATTSPGSTTASPSTTTTTTTTTTPSSFVGGTAAQPPVGLVPPNR